MSEAGAGLGFVLCGLVLVLVIAAIFGAVIRAACALYNALAGGKGSPYAVPQPDFDRAMGIALLTLLVNAMSSLVLNGALGAPVAALATSPQGPTLVAQAISLPLGLLVMAALLTAMLPTGFGRAMLVTLCCWLLTILVLVALAVVIVGALLLVGTLGRA